MIESIASTLDQLEQALGAVPLEAVGSQNYEEATRSLEESVRDLESYLAIAKCAMLVTSTTARRAATRTLIKQLKGEIGRGRKLVARARELQTGAFHRRS
jgi:hypothetical protein